MNVLEKEEKRGATYVQPLGRVPYENSVGDCSGRTEKNPGNDPRRTPASTQA